MKNKLERIERIERLVKRINSENLIILEGAISVLSAIHSDYANIIKIILKLDLQNRNTQKILSAVHFDMIEYFSHDEFNIFEDIINKSGIYSKRDFTIGKTHGGIIALASKRRFLTPDELISKTQISQISPINPINPINSTNPQNPQTIAVIEGIEDPYNLGYAVRALYTQGIDGLILPERDFGFSESVIEKASTGTFYKMPAAVFSNSNKSELIKLLKTNNFKIYCIDKKVPPDLNGRIKVRNIFDVEFADKTAFIIGGEKRGISKDFLNNADEIVRIPYANSFAHSLAAQTAATIMSYEIHRQRWHRKQ